MWKGRQSRYRECPRSTARPESCRYAAHQLDIHDAWQTFNFVRRAAGTRFDETHRGILPHHDAELLIDEYVHDVEECQSDKQDGYREGDAEHRDGCPDWLALEIPQDHSGDQRGPEAARRPLEDTLLVP